MIAIRALAKEFFKLICVPLASFLGAFGFLQDTSAAETEAMPEPGLQVEFTANEGAEGSRTDIVVLPNVWLYVPADTPPTPFLEKGAFTAVWKGFVNVDLRSSYQFQAELNGKLELEINGNTILRVQGNDAENLPSKTIRLSKGANVITATFQSPSRGEAFLRLHWIPRRGIPSLIPQSALSHQPDSQSGAADRIRLGRSLFIEHRCAKCHIVPAKKTAITELAMDAPSFEGIGARRSQSWMSDWSLNPRTFRSSARMPRMLHGSDSRKDATAIASFLGTLKSSSSLPATKTDTPAEPAERDAGEKLFSSLRCSACHTTDESSASGEGLLSLQHVNEKFTPGHLSVFLQKPEAHFVWTRMPNFRLTNDEARQLAAFLRSKTDSPNLPQEPGDSALVERGKDLVQNRGCLNCHALAIENRFAATALSDILSQQWNGGCLAREINPDSNTPFFDFTSEERLALRAFAMTDRSSLYRQVSREFATRQIGNLGCANCHGKIDGFPAIDNLGGKLKPEWTQQFIAGNVPYKPRHWLSERMPGLIPYASELARGMAALHGYPPQTPPEADIETEVSEIGRQLIASEDGFSCISCHSVGTVSATAVFESPGINFVYSTERLLKPYFTRWILNPLGIDPTSKMPVYFDEQGMSPLFEIYDGDGRKQIDAMWQYFRLGQKMQPPPGLDLQPQ